MGNVPLYQSLIMLLLITGVVPALIFLSQHRPRQWKRMAAWDASGWVIIIALFYLRSIGLMIFRWPGSPPRGWGDAIVAITTLLLVDAALIVRVISYRSFVGSERRSGVGDPHGH